MRDILNAALVASLIPTGMAVDHWAVQLRAMVRAVWRLFVLWVQAITSGMPLLGPLLAAHPGRANHRPDNRKHNRALRREFQKAKKKAEVEAERLLAEAAVLAEDEAAAEPVSEDPAEQLEKTQPFPLRLVKETA